jgi:hypothetical protein
MEGAIMAKPAPKTNLPKPTPPVPANSMDYRPRDYFGRFDLQAELLTSVKGVMRRKAIRNALEQGQIDTLPDSVKQAALEEDDRQLTGRIHPSFMGGEYLPTAAENEVEIARITLDSTTSDVTSFYARPVGLRIAYRVVDEYGGETLTGRNDWTSDLPLTMGKLIKYFLDAWDLYECLDCNFEGDVEGMLGFFSGESEFYPCFDAALRELVRQRFLDEDFE